MASVWLLRCVNVHAVHVKPAQNLCILYAPQKNNIIYSVRHESAVFNGTCSGETTVAVLIGDERVLQ